MQEELSSKILELAPQNCTNYDKIPIMSAGEDIGEKSLIKTDIDGIIVQDINDEKPGVVLR